MKKHKARFSNAEDIFKALDKAARKR